MGDLRFFSLGCRIRVLERASECKVARREELEVIEVPEDMKGQVFIVDWLGRYGALRVVHKGVDYYFSKVDVTVIE